MTISSMSYQCDSCPNTATTTSGAPPSDWGRFTISLGSQAPVSWDACATCYAAVVNAVKTAVPSPPTNIPAPLP